MVVTPSFDTLRVVLKEASFADSGSFARWAADGIAYVSGIVCGNNGERVMRGIAFETAYSGKTYPEKIFSEEFFPLGYFTREQTAVTALRLCKAQEITQEIIHS